MPIVFRGVITVGSSTVADDDIYLGKAIDEASDTYEKADGAFVWLSASARALPVDDDRRQGALVRYSVPLKCQRETDTYVVNPFVHTASGSDAGTPIRQGILAAMSGDRPDIASKRENTMRFLDHIVRTEPAPSHRGARLE